MKQSEYTIHSDILGILNTNTETNTLWIIPADSEQLSQIYRAFIAELALSRFTAITATAQHGRRTGIKIETVRLKHRKGYCGQHPGACRLTFKKRRHPVNSLLEGLDWVSFNHMLNNAIDKLDTDAKVFSFNREAYGNKYFSRLGRLRRVNYPYTENAYGFVGWSSATDVHCFEDYCGKANPPLSVNVVDLSTPGILGITEQDRLTWLEEYPEEELVHA